jgi:hypothetical protein
VEVEALQEQLQALALQRQLTVQQVPQQGQEFRVSLAGTPLLPDRKLQQLPDLQQVLEPPDWLQALQ